MDDFRRLDDFADSTDDPFGSPLGRPARAEGREPSALAAKVWHRMVGVLLALGIGGGSVALLLSILIVNLLPVVLVALLLLLASAVIAFRFRRLSPDLTAMRLIWRLTPTVGMLYGIALGVSFASANSQLDAVTIILLAGFGAVAGVFCAAGAALSVTATRYVKRRHDARIGGAAELVPIAVGSLVGAAIVMVWLVSTGRYLLPAYLSFGPTVTVLLVGALLLSSWQRWQRSRRDAQTAR